jgi:4-hydroxy-4-methyl-2-oxoglutarate aldolase
MLDEPPLLTIKKSFARPTPAQIARLEGVTTGWVVDAQQGRAALAPAVKPIFAGIQGLDRCSGVAVTCWCGPDDNLAIAAAMAIARPGDVIVAAVEGFTGSGVLGDIMAGMMRNKQIAGLVTDGCVRDLAGLREAGLPIFAAGINPNSCVRSGPGTVGLPVVVGGRLVASGDLVVADADGVTTIPLAQADPILARIAAIRDAEALVIAEVRQGRTGLPALEALLASDKVRWLD